MRHWVVVGLLLSMFMCGCGKTVQRADNHENFAKKIFNAVADRDTGDFLELCVNAKDLDLDDTPFLNDYDKRDGGIAWTENLEFHFDNFLKKVDQAGGVKDMKWISFGKAIGSLPVESGFIGNMYIEIKIDGIEYVIEIGASQISNQRGRVITTTAPLMLRTMTYYEKNTNEPQIDF